MNYKKFLKLSPKKFFVWLGLFLSVGFIAYLLSLFREGPPFFGSPLPFYYFGGYMSGIEPFSFTIDAIFWYIVSIQTSYTRFLKPTIKKVFLWLGLFFGTGFIAYLLHPLDGPPSFGFPLPFYHFGGYTITGAFLHPMFDFSFFINDAIFWYISIQTSYIRFLKPTKKKIFLWLGLFFGTGYIAYLFSFFRERLPSFGFPLPFYRFGGYMMGIFFPPIFYFSSFIIDAIFWYIISCLLFK